MILNLIAVAGVFAQTTTFTYQGRITDSTVAQPTNGAYEMQYKLFDTSTVGAGSQIGVTQTISGIAVVNGIFAVQLDFGGTVFRSLDLFIEIGVRPNGSSSAFTVLSPRQQVTTAPLAIRSRISNSADNSDALGGILAAQYVLTTNTRLTDDRNPLAGSPNYIQNQTAIPQAANLNINGNATVGGTVLGNVVDAGTQFNLGGNRVLSAGGGNVFAGISAGAATTTGGDNAFFGTNAGKTNLTGFNNSFFGTDAGRNNNGASNSFFGRSAGFANTTGGNNSFFGLDAGRFNTIGANNVFFGLSAGSTNTGGTDNSFVGLSSGFSNSIGSNNAFVGRSSGQSNSTGNTNSFFGNFAGAANTIGNNNLALGSLADFGANNLNFATAIGAGSVVSTSNTIALGRSDGSDTVRIFGLGAAGSTALCRNASNQISTCTAGGSSGINNQTVQQTGASFNIDGNGTVGGLFSSNIVNSTTNFRIGGTSVFSTPNSTSVVAGQLSNHSVLSGNNAFFGYKAGQAANGFSQANTFIGSDSGELTTSGGNNSFVGRDAGFANTSGSQNSFFGSGAGQTNSTASTNSFFGYFAGNINSTGTRNSFFGFQSGLASQTVNDNSFFGYQAGSATTGASNSFFGSSAGAANNAGTGNSFFGSSAGATTTSGSGNTFIGISAGTGNTNGSQNTVVGNSSGITGDLNTVVGTNASASGFSTTAIGTGANSQGSDSTAVGKGSQVIGTNSSAIGTFAYAEGNSNTAIGFNATVIKSGPGAATPIRATAIGAGAVANKDNQIVIGTLTDSVVVPGNISTGAVTASQLTVVSGGSLKLTVVANPSNTGNKLLCLNASNFVSRCPFLTSNDNRPYGIGGDDSPTIEFTDQIAKIDLQALLIKEQHTQIGKQTEQIKLMQMQIEALTKIVCSMSPKAELCVK